LANVNIFVGPFDGDDPSLARNGTLFRILETGLNESGLVSVQLAADRLYRQPEGAGEEHGREHGEMITRENDLAIPRDEAKIAIDGHFGLFQSARRHAIEESIFVIRYCSKASYGFVNSGIYRPQFGKDS